MLKATHHLQPDIYFSLEKILRDSDKDEFDDPIIVFGEELYIYNGHHRTAIHRKNKKEISGHHILSQKDFTELPDKYWNTNLSPKTHSYESVLVILKDLSLADDEVFN